MAGSGPLSWSPAGPLSVPEPWEQVVPTLGPLSVPEPWDWAEDWPKGRLHVPVCSSCTEFGSHAAVTLPEGPGNACCFLGCVAHPTAGQKTPPPRIQGTLTPQQSRPPSTTLYQPRRPLIGLFCAPPPVCLF